MKTHSVLFRATLALLLSTLTPQLSTCLAQGSLTPPGAPAPTMKTLQQVEPRTSISTVPYTITSAGSYYLTTNLTVVGFNGNGISISADNVTLDLNGFFISGDGDVNNSGVQVIGPHYNVCVRNGTIRNIGGGAGVYAYQAGNCRFEQLLLFGNGEQGISAGMGATVIDCVAQANGFIGIETGNGTVVRHCTVAGNGIGIDAANGCVVTECSVISNNFGGIACGFGGRIQGCAVAYNTNYAGITATNSCTIANCSVYGNWNGGIIGGKGCVVSDCSVVDNGFYGITCDAGSVVQGCASTFNFGGIYANNSLVRGCSVFENGEGIYAASSTVSGCIVQNNAYEGISVHSSPYVDSPGCYIIGNNCQGDTFDSGNGLIAIYTGNNHVEGNYVVAGFTTPGIDAYATNNVITRNSVFGYNAYLPIPNLGNDLGPIGHADSAGSPWANISH